LQVLQHAHGQLSKQHIFFEKNQAEELLVLLKMKNIDRAIQQRNNESQKDQATKKMYRYNLSTVMRCDFWTVAANFFTSS